MKTCLHSRPGRAWDGQHILVNVLIHRIQTTGLRARGGACGLAALLIAACSVSESSIVEPDSGARGDGGPHGNLQAREDAGSPQDGSLGIHALDGGDAAAQHGSHHDAATSTDADAGNDAAISGASDAGHDAATQAGSDAGTDAGFGAEDAGEDDAGMPTIACTHTISPTTRLVNPCSGATGALTVTVSAGCSWSAVSSEGPVGWLRITSGAGPRVGTGAGQTVNYSITSNRHQDARAGTITVLDEAASPTTAVTTVSQSAGHACP
jgi:Viral BACON domain